MKEKYTAKIYLEKDEMLHKCGDDLDALYTWMLTLAEGKFGNVHGDIIDNTTQEVVRKFRKAPPE